MDLRPTLSLRVFFVLDNSSTWDIPWVKYTDSSRFATIGIHCLWHWLQHCRTSHGSQVSYGACGRHALGQGRARNGLRLITGWWFQNVSNMNFIFHNKWECDHPNWRTHIFQRGGSTTNQTTKTPWKNHETLGWPMKHHEKSRKNMRHLGITKDYPWKAEKHNQWSWNFVVEDENRVIPQFGRDTFSRSLFPCAGTLPFSKLT
jgi:hypothetical protein